MIKQSDKADLKLVVQSGHKKAVNSVVFAPDGSFFVTGSNDKTVKIWDSASCLCQRTLHGHSDLVLTAVISPDGKLIASGGKDRNLIIWDALTGEKIAESYQWSFHSLLFSPDNKYILAASDETTEITVFEASSGKLTASFDTGDGIPAISFSPDGKTFVSGSHNSVLTFWEFPDGKIKKSIKTNCGRITAASYSPDGSNVIYANEQGEISIYRLETGECSKIIKTKGQVIYSVLCSSDGRFIIAADKKKNITFWDTSSYKQIKKLTGHTGAIFSVCLSPDGKYLLSGSTDASVIKWDSETGDILKTIDSNTFKLNFKALSHDGYKAASLNYDSKKHNSEVKIWDIRTCKCIRTFNFKQHQIFDIVFATDSKKVLMGDLSFEPASKGYSVNLWDIETGSKIMDFCEDDSFENMVVTPDGKQIFEAVSVYENNTPELKINIRDISSGEIVEQKPIDCNIITSMGFSQSGKLMVTGHNYDLSVRIWDLATLQCLKYMAGHDIYDYHPEIPSSPEGHSEWVNAVVFAENDTILFSASADKTVKKWDAEDGKCLQNVEAGNSSIESLCLTENGKILISGSSDATIKIWEASSLKCLTTILFFEDQWIAYTPDLNFDCSSGAEKLFSWVAGKKVFPAEILFKEYHKPDLIAGVLS